MADGQVAFPSGGRVPARGLLSELGNGAYTLGFRAHQLAFDTDRVDHHYTFSAKVLVSEITGSESFVHVALGEWEWVAVALGVHNLAPGAPLEVGIDPSKVFVFDKSGRLAAAPSRVRGAAA